MMRSTNHRKLVEHDPLSFPNDSEGEQEQNRKTMWRRRAKTKGGPRAGYKRGKPVVARMRGEDRQGMERMAGRRATL
jgi:hypothetical protein